VFNWLKEDAHFQSAKEILSRSFHPYAKQQTRRENYMKKLLLIALVASGLAFVPVQRSDAQVSVGIGVGYPGYYGYYPYGYYRPYPYYGYYRPYYWYGGHRYYRHHRYHYYYRY
jgi:hypothetical protein